MRDEVGSTFLQITPSFTRICTQINAKAKIRKYCCPITKLKNDYFHFAYEKDQIGSQDELNWSKKRISRLQHPPNLLFRMSLNWAYNSDGVAVRILGTTLGRLVTCQGHVSGVQGPDLSYLFSSHELFSGFLFY